MSLWRQVSRGLRALFNRKAADQEIADEIAHFLDESAATFAARGLAREEALRAARLELGGATAVHVQVRGYGWENAMDTLFSDLRYAARRLARNRSFVAISILTLGLGIGASAAIFTIIERVLLQPLDYPQSGQLVTLMHTAPGVKLKELGLSASLYFTYREENRVFQDLSIWTGDNEPPAEGKLPPLRPFTSITPGCLSPMGSRLIAGRDPRAATRPRIRPPRH